MSQKTDEFREAVKRMNAVACDQCGECPSACPVSDKIKEFNPRRARELRRLAIKEGRYHSPSIVEAAKSVAEKGVIQQPQAMRTRRRERKDRSSLGLPPAEKSRDLERARSQSREVLVSLSEVSSRSVKITMDGCD